MATIEELWSLGQSVALEVGKTLHGRADILAAVCREQQLQVDADPQPANPNHANVRAWPIDKPAQKIIAQEIARTAVFIAKD
jgi:hypothetical protein